MSAGAVIVHGLSKRYHLTGRRENFPTLRDALVRALSPANWRRRMSGAEGAQELWALRDVSFAIEPGEIVGVIGSNGAGKSTLLKVLSRITEPTSGSVEIRGRIGSLLEVGTGFHPELTGRENVFLNGAVLGMKRREIMRRFDEIVAFAEVEEFLETPVKRYSSGMAVRLAFSVAAHLEPEILLVDEVLAVGDAAFQRKCLGKMDDVAGSGRTVLFVSHNMAVVQAFCRRGLVIGDGRLEFDGPVADAVAAYLHRLERVAQRDLRERTDRRGWQEARVIGIDLRGDESAAGAVVPGGSAALTFHLSALMQQMSLTFAIVNGLGHVVTQFSSVHEGPRDTRTDGGFNFVCEIPSVPLVPGRYRVDLTLRGGGHLQDQLEGAAYFDVEESAFDGRGIPRADIRGDVFVAHRWTCPTSSVPGEIPAPGFPVGE